MNKRLSLRYDKSSLKYYHDKLIEEFLEFYQPAFDFDLNRLEQLPDYINVQEYLANNKLHMIGTLALAEGHLGRCITVLEFYNMQHEVWKFADELAKFEGRLISTPSEKRALWRKIKKDLKIKRNIKFITKNQYVNVLYYLDAERVIAQIWKNQYYNFPKFKKEGSV